MALNVINPGNYNQLGYLGTVGNGGTNWGLGGDVFNTGNAQLGLGALQGVSALLGAFGGMNQNKMMKKQLNLARDQFAFQKDVTNRNFANQLQAFNNALEDKVRSRAAQENRPDGYAEQYFEDHKLRG